jgi:epoxyqueuosine reductase
MASSPEQNRHLLEQLRQQCSLDLLGVADASQGGGALAGFPQNVRDSLPLAVVVAIRVSHAVLSTLEDGPNLLYLHHYRQLNAHLDRAATVISAEIERQGCSALPVPASQIVDWKKMSGQVSHKAIARLAGLGWHGRNNLLVTPQLGSQVRLATILTDLPLSPDHPLEADCGSCRRCVAVCPAKARDPGRIRPDSVLSEARRVPQDPEHTTAHLRSVREGLLRADPHRADGSVEHQWER